MGLTNREAKLTNNTLGGHSHTTKAGVTTGLLFFNFSFFNIHLHRNECDEVQYGQHKVQRGPGKSVGQQWTKDATEAPPRQSHRVDSRCIGHAEPLGQ